MGQKGMQNCKECYFNTERRSKFFFDTVVFENDYWSVVDLLPCLCSLIKTYLAMKMLNKTMLSKKTTFRMLGSRSKL